MPNCLQLPFAAVRDGRWYWGLGDPDLGAVLVTGLYLLTSIICLVVARRLRLKSVPVSIPTSSNAPSSSLRKPAPPPSGEKGHSEAVFWLVLGLLLFCLGINKQGDFQSLLTLYGRDILRQAGLYDVRRTIQVVFILGVAVIACSSVVVGLWYVRRLSWTSRAAALGLGLQAAFIVIRAASFHHLDVLLGARLGNLKLNLLFESIGLFMILIAAMCCWAQTRGSRQ
jgi:hypothetical protein